MSSDGSTDQPAAIVTALMATRPIAPGIAVSTVMRSGDQPEKCQPGHGVDHPAHRAEEHEQVAEERAALEYVRDAALGHHEQHAADRHRDAADGERRGRLPCVSQTAIAVIGVCSAMMIEACSGRV